MIEDEDEEGRAPGETVAANREREVLARIVEVAQLRELLQHEAMRDFLWRVLAHTHVFATVFDQNALRMALNEGRRQVGVWLITELNEANPDALMAMQLKAARAASEEARDQREQTARKQRRS